MGCRRYERAARHPAQPMERLLVVEDVYEYIAEGWKDLSVGMQRNYNSKRPSKHKPYSERFFCTGGM